ncbi:WD repeat-containing protein 83 [Nowakowskiella sp. JEL0078]|nr:WD repeat-containing protein 83 [Nowakowskiella sp. JEL0078]
MKHNEVAKISGHVGPVYTVRYTLDCAYCISGGADRSVKLWNPVKGTCIKTYNGHSKEVLGVTIAQDNSRFATCGKDKNALIWDVGTGATIKRISGHNGRINAVAFNSEATVLATASYDSTVKLWDCRAQSRFPIQTLEHASDDVMTAEIVDKQILTGSVDGHVRIYDIRTGEVIDDCIGPPVTSTSFSSDRQCILVSTLDNTIRLFDKENGELLSEYKGHKNIEYKLTSCLTNSDSHVVSGSEDGKIYFWDLVEGKNTQILKGHTQAVTCVSYHRKEDSFLSCSLDGTIRLWICIIS